MKRVAMNGCCLTTPRISECSHESAVSSGTLQGIYESSVVVRGKIQAHMRHTNPRQTNGKPLSMRADFVREAEESVCSCTGDLKTIESEEDSA